MPHFLRKIPHPHPEHPWDLQVWKFEADAARRIGVAHPERGVGTFFKANPGESILDAIRRQTDWFGPEGQNPFYPAVQEPGTYYPRIARPIDQHPDEVPGHSPGALAEQSVIAIARSQLQVLTRQLDRICQTVHPTPKTFSTYGHDIRNLLILACTEVEAHWRGVLRVNGLIQQRYTTKHYVRLLSAMHLDGYAVSFPNYPWLDPISPFQGWNSINSTDSLPWYSAYNAVKHDREGSFERATLRHIFEAVTACYIMQISQFGLVYGIRYSEAANFFHVASGPTWSPCDVYIEPYDNWAGGWSPVSYPF